MLMTGQFRPMIQVLLPLSRLWTHAYPQWRGGGDHGHSRQFEAFFDNSVAATKHALHTPPLCWLCGLTPDNATLCPANYTAQ